MSTKEMVQLEVLSACGLVLCRKGNYTKISSHENAKFLLKDFNISYGEGWVNVYDSEGNLINKVEGDE